MSCFFPVLLFFCFSFLLFVVVVAVVVVDSVYLAVVASVADF